MKNSTKLFSIFLALSLCTASKAAAAEYLLVFTASTSSSLQDLVRSHPLISKSGRSLFPDLEKTALHQLGKDGLAQSLIIDLPTPQSVSELRDWIKKNQVPAVLETNHEIFALSYSEPLQSEQWGLNNRGLPQRVDIDFITTQEIPGVVGEDVHLPKNLPTNRSVIVAVLDTGIDLGHPDLQGQIVNKSAECEALKKFKECKDKGCADAFAHFDSDGNGYPMDCNGWNVVGKKDPVTGIVGNQDVHDEIGHGTHVAGVIAAAINGIGIRGIAPNAKILPVKVVREAPSSPVRPLSNSDDNPVPEPDEKSLNAPITFTDVVARGVLYAIRSGADVINLSLGWPGLADSQLMREMVSIAESKNILVVAAAGNDSTDALVSPCQYSGVICVGAHGPDGKMSHFSNFGSGVDIAAPGLNILSTWPTKLDPEIYTDRKGYEFKDGTSMAAPHVAGALALLLSTGMPPAEAYSRLLSGARPQPVSDPKYVLAGNLDIQGSLDVTPRPYFVPVNKSVVPVLWDRISNTIPVEVEFKNTWIDAKNVTVSVQVSESDKKYAQIALSEQKIDAVKSQETVKFQRVLEILNRNFPSDLHLIVKITPENGKAQNAVVQLQVSVPMYKDFNGPGVLVQALLGTGVSPNSSLRTITSLNNLSIQDFMAIEKQPKQTLLQLLKDDGNSNYASSIQRSITPVNGDLLLIQKISLNQDLKNNYVMIYRTPPPEGSRIPAYRFDFYDSDLQPLSSFTHLNDVAVLLERFQWIKLDTKPGVSQLVPAWIVRGSTPSLEKSTYDPWNPTPDDFPVIRLYYISPDGLRSVTPPEGWNFLDMMTPSENQKNNGVMPVLLAKTDNYITDYGIAEVTLGRQIEVKALGMEKYRNLRGLSTIEIKNLNSADLQSFGTAFSGTGVLGSQRTTAFWFDQGVNTSVKILENLQLSPQSTTSVARVNGAFYGPRGFSTFAQGHYDLQFNESSDPNRTITTSLRRYSFLPGLLFYQSFFPVVVGTENFQNRIPGILIPDGLGANPGSEIILPTYDDNGSLERLLRPARLRFQSTNECESLGNPIEANQYHPSMLTFFCGDRFIKVPLSGPM